MKFFRLFVYLILANLIYFSAFAQVAHEVHEKCKEARDHVGCVKDFGAAESISTKTINKQIEPVGVSESESSQIKLEVKPELPSAGQHEAAPSVAAESKKVELQELLRLATEEGNAEAQTQLGKVYYFGKGVPEDYKEAVKWYRLAADQGDSEAQFSLGFMYLFGQGGLRENTGRALHLWRLSAQQGNARAQTALGVSHFLGEDYFYGATVRQDYELAIQFLKSAAEQGEEEAQYYLAEAYSHGLGVSKDHVKASNWLLLAAQGEYTEAQVALGVSYLKGIGVPQDNQEALKWFRLAAEKGDPTGQTNLAVMYTDGLGITQNHKEAVRWYLQAAEQGNSKAQFNLGIMYANGQGVAQDFVYAYMWLKLSAKPKKLDGLLEEGEKNTRKIRNKIKNMMTSSQVKVARQLEKQCVKKNYKDC